MSERLERIYKLLKDQKSRASYIQGKLGVLVPAQIRALRLKSSNPPMPYQRDLAGEAEVQQSRISMFETPGAANITLETLAKVAAGLRVGVVVKFVSFHEMLHWENSFSPDTFNVTPRLEEDEEFLNPGATQVENDGLIAASFIPERNLGASPAEQDETRATNARKPPARHVFAQGAAVGGI
jgi:transcriptional regulator with XRE-family HTH domain